MKSEKNKAAATGKPGEVSWRGGVAHIEVRGLPPPEPFRAILMLLEEVPEGTVIVVHHDRSPIYLFPELAERGWEWRQLEAPAGEVRLELRQSGRPDHNGEAAQESGP